MTGYVYGHLRTQMTLESKSQNCDGSVMVSVTLAWSTGRDSTREDNRLLFIYTSGTTCRHSFWNVHQSHLL